MESTAVDPKSVQALKPSQWISLIMTYLSIPLILLICGWDFSWRQAWVFSLLIVTAGIGGRMWAERRHPGLLAERAKYEKAPGVKPWDKVIAPLMGVSLSFPLVIAAGLDHRFGWSPLFPMWLNILGLVLITLGYTFAAWALVENRFFTSMVRIQTERGHVVCDSGPYRIVRHPGYAGNILALPGIVLALGSVWTLIPAAVALVIAVIRTALEDRTLQEELPGYLEYARRVRYRLVPGIYTLCNAVTLAIIASSLASCGGRLQEASREPQVIASPLPMAIVTPAVPSESSLQSTPATPGARYGFPTQIDPTKRYLFYLHGRIIEDQGLPAISPEYGEYQYQEILSVLESYGYVVISEQRPKNADGWKYAQRTARQVAELLKTGVPPDSITVVGASKGASIAAVVSSLVDNTELNYVLLGSCHPTLIDEWKQEGLTLSGNVLAIYDFADVEYSGSCEEIFGLSEGKGLGRHDEILLQVGTGHGILYKPLPEWVLPTVKWANQE